HGLHGDRERDGLDTGDLHGHAPPFFALDRRIFAFRVRVRALPAGLSYSKATCRASDDAGPSAYFHGVRSCRGEDGQTRHLNKSPSGHVRTAPLTVHSPWSSSRLNAARSCGRPLNATTQANPSVA